MKIFEDLPFDRKIKLLEQAGYKVEIQTKTFVSYGRNDIPEESTNEYYVVYNNDGSIASPIYISEYTHKFDSVNNVFDRLTEELVVEFLSNMIERMKPSGLEVF